jgi:hypothetical protein
MHVESSATSRQLTLPADMLESVLRDAERLAAETERLLAPVAEQRQELRERLEQEGQILAVPDEPSTTSLGAVDGGCVVDQLYAADRLVVAALVAEGLHTVHTGELHHATWTQTVSHQPDLDRLASAVMVCLELSLLRGINYETRIFDGSHQTPIIVLNSALSSRNPEVRRRAAEIVAETGAVDALEQMCDDRRGKNVVGLPKADSSTEFCVKYTRDYGFRLPPITDRFLAAQVLDRGEMLLPRKPQNWHQLHINARRDNDQPETVEPDPTVAKFVQEVAGALDTAIKPLRHSHTPGRGVGITYLKPHSSDACIKIEFKASTGREHGTSLAAVLAAEVSGPHMQEPYAQFVADLWAKNVSMAADALAAAARHRMPADSPWSRYLLLGYRSSIAGAHL